MYRSYLLLLFVFLFSHFVTNAQENDLTLKSVSVDTASQKITLTWLYNSNADSVTIYKCTNNCDNQNNYHEFDKVKMDTDTLRWIDENANLAIRNHYSIGWLNSGKTAPKNNMVLKADAAVNGCFNVVLLSWNPYIQYAEFSWNPSAVNRMDTLDYYIFYKRKNMDTSFILLDSIMGTHSGNTDPVTEIRYETPYLKNDTLYEFVIQAIGRMDTARSFSNIVTYTTGFEIDTLVPVTITCISVLEDKYIEIDVITDNFPEPFQKLYLLRAHPGKEVWAKDSLSFKVIDSLEYSTTNAYRFTDEDINVKAGLYYYMVVADNRCKTNDTSNVLTNIYLHGKRMEKYTDSIYFSHVSIPFNPELYDLFRVVYSRNILITSGLTMIGENNSAYVNVEPFMHDGAAIKYQVESENNCYSNTLTIEHEPHVIFPNAFYPQSANIENTTFYPILQFPSEDDYLFIVYNRWGQELYRSTLPPVYGDYENPQGRWDGTFRGEPCPSGIYAFRISYSFNERSGKYSHTGSVILVR